MIVYSATKSRFLQDVLDDTIADNIDDAFFAHLGRHTSRNEKNSWKNSMQYMYRVMATPDIPDNVGVAIEYQIPLTSKRVDFIVSGNDDSGKGNMVIVELKQWSSAFFSDKDGLVITRFEFGDAETSHPSYQAWSYAYMLENYNLTIQQRGIKLTPCAYLHNYEPDNVITDARYAEYLDKAPVFLRHDATKLQSFIKEHIRYGATEDLMWLVEGGELRPSKQLADAVTSMVKGNPEFVMIDEQKVVYENVIDLAQKSQRGKKNVIIVQGGPGTGKSVLAIRLLAELTKNEISCQYVSKNAAPRDVYSAKLSRSFKKTFINNLFVGSGGYVDKPENIIGALIVDEAHRLTEKSGFYGTNGDNQIREIIRSARFSVFFIDDRQRVHVRDIGSTKTIKDIAEDMGAKVTILKLESQFRCNGSDGYLAWVDNALQIIETANINLSTTDYDFKIIDNPNDLFDEILRKNALDNKSRVVAGYCWPWNKKDMDKPDIEIPEYHFAKKWNLSSEGNYWIIGPNSVNQIGCIHTCQGLELDYVGVILGPDILFRNGRIVTDVSAHPGSDAAVAGLKSKTKANDGAAQALADEIIKNTYRTLMTRGMKGCYVFCCDKPLAQYLKGLLSIPETEQEEPRLELSVSDNVKFIDFLPVYTLKAACGYFGEGEQVDVAGWMKFSGGGKLNRNMFIVQAKGHSMEPVIHDGDYCVFRANPAGSREGKILLVQNHTLYDSEYGGSYAIKQYSSIKTFNQNGTWQHSSIQLKPLNPDFSIIQLDETCADEFRVIGEFVSIVK